MAHIEVDHLKDTNQLTTNLNTLKIQFLKQELLQVKNLSAEIASIDTEKIELLTLTETLEMTTIAEAIVNDLATYKVAKLRKLTPPKSPLEPGQHQYADLTGMSNFEMNQLHLSQIQTCI